MPPVPTLWRLRADAPWDELVPFLGDDVRWRYEPSDGSLEITDVHGTVTHHPRASVITFDPATQRFGVEAG